MKPGIQPASTLCWVGWIIKIPCDIYSTTRVQALLRGKAGEGGCISHRSRAGRLACSTTFLLSASSDILPFALGLSMLTQHKHRIFAVEKKMAHQNLTTARFVPSFSVLIIPSVKRSSSIQSIWTTLCICCLPGGILVHYSDEKYRG